jgi:hypothetical protein
VVIRDLLAVAHGGITLSAINYVRGVGADQSMLTVSGTATTRDALRVYQHALQDARFAQSAELPVSAYAKDSSIPFSIDITLVP